MRDIVASLTLIVTLPLLGGCGQMGPLYLPQDTASEDRPTEQTDNSQQPPSAP